MVQYGLIGNPLIHSFSKKYFIKKFKNEHIFNVDYENFELKNISKIKELISRNPNLKGLNVTIPYKEKVFKYLDKIDEKASKIGAVNVIKILNNKLIGFNSDYLAFKHSLQKWISKDFNAEALVLGTGGSSKAISQALKDLNINHKFVSRNKNKNYKTYKDIINDPKIILDHKLIINTTPLGMYPKISSMPNLPYELITEEHYFYDLVYNPEKSEFLKKAEKNKARIKNGLEMLYTQAEISWELWNK